nr:MAG TPA: hypothetical protein [Caudoviricetes sp.]
MMPIRKEAWCYNFIGMAQLGVIWFVTDWLAENQCVI